MLAEVNNALKVLHPDAPPSERAAMLREARLAERIDHQNVVPVYDVALMPGA